MRKTNVGKSKRNLLSLSNSDDFKVALNEWSFNGVVRDYFDKTERCELCEHHRLRYHYLIKNTQNANQLWVGSSCILKFDEIEVCDEYGTKQSETNDRKHALKEWLIKHKKEVIRKAIKALWNSYSHEALEQRDLEFLFQKFTAQNALPPTDLLTLFEKMDERKIEYSREYFRVNLSKNIDKWVLDKLPPERISQLKPCFSKSQLLKFSYLFEKD